MFYRLESEMIHARKTAIFLLFTIVSVTNLMAQARNIVFERLNTTDGLSSNIVQCIYQDNDGYLWIGTADGLNRYDGYRFKIFRNDPQDANSISNNSIQYIYEDLSDDLWIGTEDGLSLFNRKKETFTTYRFNPTTTITAQISRFLNWTTHIHEDKNGNLWLGTSMKGLVRFDRKTKAFTSLLLDSIGSNNDVEGIINDPKDANKLWLAGGLSGLSSFDIKKGKFTFFQPNSKQSENLGKDFIGSIVQDNNGNIWYGSWVNGLKKFNPQTKQFTHYKHDPKNRTSLSNNRIRIIFNTADNKNVLWIGTKDGLNRFDMKSNLFTVYKSNPADLKTLSDSFIQSIYKDRSGVLWIGTRSGLNKFDPGRAPFRFHKSEVNTTGQINSAVNAIITSISDPNIAWLGTNAGLNRLNLKKNTHTIYKHNPDDPMSISGDSISVIYEDPDEAGDALWVAVEQKGLLRFDLKKKKFKSYSYNPDDHALISGNTIGQIYKTRDGMYWLATLDGLNKFDRKKGTFTRYLQQDTTYIPAIQKRLRRMVARKKPVAAILKVGNFENRTREFELSQKTQMLVVALGEGAQLLFMAQSRGKMYDYGWLENRAEKTIWKLDLSKSLHAGGDAKNRMQIGLLTLEPGRYKLRYLSDDSHAYGSWNAGAPIDQNMWGIQVFEINNTEYKQINRDIRKVFKPNSIAGNMTTTILEDSYGMLWIGTVNNGLSKLDRKTGLFTNYKFKASNPAGISNNNIQTLHEDKNGTLWIGTRNGLNKYNPKTDSFSGWFIKDGLPNNSISNILEDAMGNLWLATNNGISKFDPLKAAQNGYPTFINYNIQDGLPYNQYISGSMHRATSGEMFFGSNAGFVSFFPGKNNPFPPHTVISKFLLFNKEVIPGKDSPLKKHISETPSLKLTYDQNMIAFEFTGLHFARPEKNKYLYKMEGVDKSWIDGGRRYASYTNLEPGRYIFRVKSSNGDGVWDTTGRSLSIDILPPWWRTTAAYILFGFLFAATGFAIDRFQRRRLLVKTKERMKIQAAEYRAEAAELQAKAVEAQSQMIQAENQRKSKELEEARQLQLSMLPKELPQLPNLDIAVYMQTATEVGGDYYDFHVGLDGTLTVVIGDATGHGMRAGTMVTAAKSLFNSYAPNPDILFSFAEITRCIKQMNFGKLSMCLTMLKIKGDKMQISTAGMPPSFIFRKDTRVVEEHLFQAMPLGTMVKFPYELKNTTLNNGDTILLMSDGLPELINSQEEMYGYKRIRNGFEDVADKTPDEIISFFKNEGAAWANNKDPDDDVTFVVIKVK